MNDGLVSWCVAAVTNAYFRTCFSSWKLKTKNIMYMYLNFVILWVHKKSSGSNSVKIIINMYSNDFDVILTYNTCIYIWYLGLTQKIEPFYTEEIKKMFKKFNQVELWFLDIFPSRHLYFKVSREYTK